jgi:signal peptidase I
VKIPYPQLVSSRQDPRLTRIDVVLGAAAQKPVAPFEQTLFDNTGLSLPGDETSMLTGTATTDILTSDFASFTFNISQFYAGAAHPFATIETFNFDERTGRLIKLADLFQPGSDWLSVLSQECRSLLAAVAAVGPIGTGSGTSPVASNFSAWALTPWGLSIQFQEYQVGPYADGQPTIMIPFSALRSVALASGPLASVEASRPLRSPLLPAVVPPAVNECMAPTSWGPAGPTPLRCSSGALNVGAWNEWNVGGNDSVTGLGRGVTLKTVERAMCADVKFDPSYSAPYEIRLETLSALYYGWLFTTNPALDFPSYCRTVTRAAVQTFLVTSGSMLPTLQIGDRLVVVKSGYTVHRGDIVVFKRPPADIGTTDVDLVKRVIGLPGETISSRGNTVFINGQALAEPWLSPLTGICAESAENIPTTKIPTGHYFVMGDCRGDSADSRTWGTLLGSLIVGKVSRVEVRTD